VVSLPDYADTATWFLEADYQYFSTAHWHPIANGYSRTAPAGFHQLMGQLSTFPSPAAAGTMRSAGIRYVVFHARKVENGARVAGESAASGGFRLIAQRGDDYLFEVADATRPKQ
jgi:hypothetical protein